MEAVSVVLDVLGKNKLYFLLAAFVLSALGYALTLCAYIKRRTSTPEVPAERQLRVVELVFSSIQLIASFVQFLLARLKVEKNFDASVYPLAFAMIVVVFVFENDEKGTSPPGDYHQPIELDLIGTLIKNQVGPSSSNSDSNKAPVDLQPNLNDNLSWNNIKDGVDATSPKGHMPPLVDFQALNFMSDSTPIEADQFEVSSTGNQVNPPSTLRMRTNVTSKMEPTAAPQANHHDHSLDFEEDDVVKIHQELEDHYKNVWIILPVQMADTGAQKNIELQNLTCYEDLYKKVSQTFNIEVEYLDQHSKWVLIYKDDESDLLYLGNDPWE
ncbi:hypothetical protein ACOSQ4_003923 [Xanthoceras sorbifolium]